MDILGYRLPALGCGNVDRRMGVVPVGQARVARLRPRLSRVLTARERKSLLGGGNQPPPPAIFPDCTATVRAACSHILAAQWNWSEQLLFSARRLPMTASPWNQPMPMVVFAALVAWLAVGMQSTSDSALSAAFREAMNLAVGAAVIPISLPIEIGISLSAP